MKKIIAPVIAGVLVLGLLAGCGAKEREALKTEVASLKQELTTAKETLAAKESELTALQTELQTVKDAEAAAAAKVAELGTQLDAAKADLAKALAPKKKK